MIDWDELERRGHQFTMVAPMHIGRSLYWCENCGSFIVVRENSIVAAGVPLGSGLRFLLQRCLTPHPSPAVPTLAKQLRDLDDADLEALRERDR